MHFWRTASENFGIIPWTSLTAAVWFLVGLALLFDFLNGLHDAANSIATVVSTRVLRPHYAVGWAAFFNFIAFLVFGTHVAETLGTGIIDPGIVDPQVIFAALMGAIVWNVLTWWLGIPSSSSHALIGGIVGHLADPAQMVTVRRFALDDVLVQHFLLREVQKRGNAPDVAAADERFVPAAARARKN